MSDEYSGRCMALIIGTGYIGRWYCGNRAKTEDVHGRPVCGRHKDGHPGIEWFGDRYKFPEGTGGVWGFSHGESRMGR